jgi:MFS family permease
MFYSSTSFLSPFLAFSLVSFSLGELGDGLNIFQGVYLVGLGWNEGSVGIALSLMGLTALIVQTVAGDVVDKTSVDRRLFLSAASILTAVSALAILLVREGNTEHLLIFTTKVVEGIASSFIGPCLGALTLASFGPRGFDVVMANNVFWGHVGSVVAAILAGVAAHLLYPNVKYCFLVIAFSALTAVLFVMDIPQGDPLMGRGFQGKYALDLKGNLEPIPEVDSRLENEDYSSSEGSAPEKEEETPQAASYWEVFSDPMTCVLSLTGFFFHFANANVLLVLGELMGGDNEDGSVKRSAIPLIAGAIVLAQLTMAAATVAGDRLTRSGVGRKPLFIAGLVTLPIRCALIVYFKEAGEAALLSTQILDGIGAGLSSLLHPYLVADITFGTGRFNVISK